MNRTFQACLLASSVPCCRSPGLRFIMSPGERSLSRPDLPEPRFRIVIATSNLKPLRRPLESAQYCSCDYQRLLKAYDITASMSGKGNCYDNAMVETVFKTIKSEMIWRTSFQTRQQATKALGRYIEGFFNPIRHHSASGYKSPIKFETAVTQVE